MAVRVILTSDVKGYRKAARALVKGKDRVLEIGCASGKTTKIVAEIAEKVVAVDKSALEVSRARERLKGFTNVVIEVKDATEVNEVKKLINDRLNGRVDVVMIDLGGVADPGEVLSLTRRYSFAFKPKLCIVKNRLLIDFIKSCEIYQ